MSSSLINNYFIQIFLIFYQILDVIFANLPLPDLKNSRLVCHEWADVGVTLLGKRARIHVNKLFTCKRSKLAKVPPVPDKLTRRLLISDKFDPSIRSNKKKAEAISKAITTHVSQLTREIKFTTTHKQVIPPFLEAIRELGSTKVQHVEITCLCQPKSAYKIPADAYEKVPPQTNLTSLKVKLLSGHRYSRSSSWYEFQPLLKVWVDAAPNLTTLEVEASLYPYLEGCKSLKILKFKFGTMYNGNSPDLSLARVAEMLAEVKDSLVELELSKSGEGGVRVEQVKKIILDRV